jgi:hypothetical protein
MKKIVLITLLAIPTSPLTAVFFTVLNIKQGQVRVTIKNAIEEEDTIDCGEHILAGPENLNTDDSEAFNFEMPQNETYVCIFIQWWDEDYTYHHIKEIVEPHENDHFIIGLDGRINPAFVGEGEEEEGEEEEGEEEQPGEDHGDGPPPAA